MKKYVFKPYLPIFPQLFEHEKQRIQRILDNSDLIEHVGSTAIPSLGGKGIIDIYIATRKDKMILLSEKLHDIGYEYNTAGGNKERRFHSQDLPDPVEKVRRYHVHVTFLGSQEWIRAIKLRDYLRLHPEYVQKYAEAKKLAAEEANEDRETYLKIKTTILEEIIKKSLKTEF